MERLRGATGLHLSITGSRENYIYQNYALITYVKPRVRAQLARDQLAAIAWVWPVYSISRPLAGNLGGRPNWTQF
jgi:hypothetical protein